jgi:hypothetical protein
MTFTVLWSQNAEDKLALLWLSSTDRQAVTDAADNIDAILRRQAETAGESRPMGRRILHETPLGVIYSVSHDDRMVLVLDVWRFGTK